jgi:mono/diheme cytochrome c family protein
MKNVLLTLLAVIILGLAGALFMIFSGTYNVAATSKDSGFMHWVLSATREASIESRAEDVIPPSDKELSDPQTIRTGFEHYDEMCVGCHGAPGVKPGELRAGLNPEPPLLAEEAEEVSTQELFWVVKHGIKMTGMPAWGPTHDDKKIWAIVAFVKKMPELSAEEYQSMKQQMSGAEHDHGADHHHDQ